MAIYESKYAELAFYVDGKLRKFQYGKYKTDDPKEVEVLDKLVDVKRVDEPKQTKPAEEPKASGSNESKPKATAKKPSAK